MKGPYTGEPGQDWWLTDGPYSFTGPPTSCVGALDLVNGSDDKVKVRALEVSPPRRKHKGCLPLEKASVTLEARVPPHGNTRVQARLQCDPHTPPGLYEGLLKVGNKTQPLQVEILENQALDLEPRHFWVRGTSGDVTACRLQLTNPGNVPIKLGKVAMVWLRERNWIGRTLVYSLRETKEQDSYEDFANRLLHNLRDSMVSPAILELDPQGEIELQPGQRLQRQLTIRLPAGLVKGRQYLGFIKINEYRIWMELYCNGAPGSSKRR